jgi:2-keto-4-pentenoate hydratase
VTIAVPDVAAIASRLIAAYDSAASLAPITAEHPAFDVSAAYDVLHEIQKRRLAQGWRPVGRKIGFTNRTIWARYGVYQPMWANVYAQTVHDAPEGRAMLPLDRFVEPRIEPEVVFGLSAPLRLTDDPEAMLQSVRWIAAGFEIVQSHFPGWKFAAADCTAAFGLHGALVIGPRVEVTLEQRAALFAKLPAFRLILQRGDTVVDEGVGANVLGSPALALAHLARVLATQPQFAPLAAGEVVTTGTVTDAWPVTPGETWSSDYGTLGVPGLTLAFT